MDQTKQDQAQQVMMKARLEAVQEAAGLNVIESVLADYSLLYRAAESSTVEDIRDGLGQLMDKLQNARKESLERQRIMDQLAVDIRSRLKAEAAG
jgi:hypothetical protein